MRFSLGDAAYDALFAEFATRAVDPEQFLEHFGGPDMGGPYEVPDPRTCLKIQCGAITQDQAGQKLLFECANGGFVGARSCADPLCAPYCGKTAAAVARVSAQPLPVAPRVEQMFLQGPQRGCEPVYWGPKFGGPYTESLPCGCGARGFINDHPFLSVALLAASAYGIYRWRAGR